MQKCRLSRSSTWNHIFYKDKNGSIFHTYSSYARGTESVFNTYNYLDLVPKGRDENHLPFTMSWVRHHDRSRTAT